MQQAFLQLAPEPRLVPFHLDKKMKKMHAEMTGTCKELQKLRSAAKRVRQVSSQSWRKLWKMLKEMSTLQRVKEGRGMNVAGGLRCLGLECRDMAMVDAGRGAQTRIQKGMLIAENVRKPKGRGFAHCRVVRPLGYAVACGMFTMTQDEL